MPDAPRPKRGERVTTLDLAWQCRARDVPPTAAAVYLDAAAELLPAALPRRFGLHEPLSGSLQRAGREGFDRAWREADGWLFLAGSLPCTGGSLDAPPGATGAPAWQLTLTLLAEPLTEPAVRDAARALLVRLADELGAFHAHARVKAGALWTGRGLAYDGWSGWDPSLVQRGVWVGLFPGDAWWTWLGEPYRPWRDRLPAARCTPARSGTLYDALPAADGAASPLTTWLPGDLFATILPTRGGEYPPPVPAPHIPDALR